MKKRRRGKHSHERWLISYADFITLLFAFFVVLFATGQSDSRKKVELAASIQSAFNQMGIFDTHSRVASGTQLTAIGASSVPTRTRATFSGFTEQTEAVKRQIEESAQLQIDQGVIEMRESPEGLIVSLQEAGFFESGASDIRPSALPVLERIAAVLPERELRIEGHTDNVPIHTSQFASNWELSSARASTVAHLLLRHPNVHPELLSVAGYAEFHPVASNDTAEGRTRNRRVDIVVLNRPDR